MDDLVRGQISSLDPDKPNDIKTALLLISQQVTSLQKEMRDFKESDVQWKAEAKGWRESENNQLKILQEFMVKQQMMSARYEEVFTELAKGRSECYERFKNLESDREFIDTMRKLYWVLVAGIVTASISSIGSIIMMLARRLIE